MRERGDAGSGCAPTAALTGWNITSRCALSSSIAARTYAATTGRNRGMHFCGAWAED